MSTPSEKYRVIEFLYRTRSTKPYEDFNNLTLREICKLKKCLIPAIKSEIKERESILRIMSKYIK
jgi:hypothetical protein